MFRQVVSGPREKCYLCHEGDLACPDALIFYRMKDIIEIPKTQIVMAFVATCIEATARHLGASYKEVYQQMKKVGMIEHYIIPHYEALHTESRENIAKGMVECLKEWEERQ